MAAVTPNMLEQLDRGEGGYSNATFQESLEQCRSCGMEGKGETLHKQLSVKLDEEKEGKFSSGKLHIPELEAKAEVKFNSWTFSKELLYHTFFPLSAPLIWYLEGGWIGLVNRGFVSTDVLITVLSQWTLSLSFYMLNAIAGIYIVAKGNWNNIYEVALVNILFVLRHSVVATKYAFTSEVEMHQMRTARVPVEVHIGRTLLSAWRDPIPRHIMKKELYLAAARCRMLTPACFRLEDVDCTDAIQDMIDDLTGDDGGGKLGLCRDARDWMMPASLMQSGELAYSRELPVHLYAAHVLWQSSSLSRLSRVGHTLLSQHLSKCAIAIGLLHGALPEVARAVFGGSPFPGPPWTVYFVPITSSLLIVFNMWASVAFMMVGILDFRRRHYVAEKLDELLRYGVYNGDRDGRDTSRTTSRSRSTNMSSRSSRTSRVDSRSSRGSTALSGQGIVVDFTDSDSLSAWWMCRLLVQNFGLGFHKRIKFYTTYFACYCGILLTYVGLRLFAGIRREDLYKLITVIFSIYVFMFLLALMVWPGGDVNLARLNHGVTLVHRKLSLQRRIRISHKDMTVEELSKAKTAVETMTSIAEAVKWDNGKNEMSICGIEAGDQLISFIVATVTASISIGVGQIAQDGFK